MPRPWWRRPLPLLGIAALLVLTGFLVWAFHLRTPELDEVFAHARWETGEVDVAGTIKGVRHVETEGGPRVVLEMEPTAWGRLMGAPEGSCLHLFADPGGHYEVGGRHHATLHFEAITFNGAPAVTAPEVACPFPMFAHAITGTLQQVARWNGGALLLRTAGSGADGWAEFEVLTANGTSYPSADVPLWLGRVTARGMPIESARDWGDEASTVFLLASQLSGSGFGEDVTPGDATLGGGMGRMPSDLGNASIRTVDSMARASEGASAGGRLRIEDTDGDGRVGDGDRVRVRLDPAPGRYEMFVVRVGDCETGCPVGPAMFLVGPSGVATWSTGEPDGVQARLERQGPDGATVRIGRSFGGQAPLDGLEAVLEVEGAKAHHIALRDAGTTDGTATLRFVDADGDGRLGEGDSLVVRAPPGPVRLYVREAGRNLVLLNVEWTAAG